MSWLEALLLGLVQGLTEFLPVSSSGHLVIFQHFLDVKEEQLAFDVAVHLGTLFSVLTVYRKSLTLLLVDFFHGIKKQERSHGLMIFFHVFLASVPTGLMGLFLRPYWSGPLSQLHFVGLFLCITGFLLLATKSRSGEMGLISFQIEGLNWKKAVFIGFMQGCAILPGISRSGATIAASLFMGLPRNSAAFFSFLLLIPAVVGAVLLELSHVSWGAHTILPMIVGLLTAYVAGWIGLKAVLKVVKAGRLEIFSPYLWAVGSALILYALFR